ncbi:hypothetical protein AUK04_05085 [Candidatus Roizmanbacteria bacterium CG2_30_33_16]|uniref:DUF6922 domain-containing protein n=4 Tax=Candidatus Roizmaniibacteriota TaxID=1752723 RepID=A0A2M7E5F4_9BACT|nr:hypothetical protein [Candidatus Roizmanbacteria bacterium]OIP82198.1 MAG: hypothetical protein AUK04_05085 [Candidatus Roizmanbacteria bacterium CG2_30_33_16]PIP64379.1 MAG: hypothetical protein COW96_02920 [Candidatus Roizmanbacteria bacterium CG22_combo_CG10-13_8_21_14_all_33_16]PIV62954.1 MAG: hypothetical protein COS12_00485 [Candidatus Roizmanbacteria bacterium CG01_land_8_20_14_3_00_33_9]PJB88116.1 MAG: hypothetical protein CO083_03460 [Candidatus Roizmanbacteria bacterium CG_4_9_14_0
MLKIIPKCFQAILWSCDLKKIDLKKDKNYIIHQFLIYGSFQDIKWLFNTYSKSEIIDVFLHAPYRNYPANIFNFVKNYILNLNQINLDESNYVTSIYGSLKQRTAASI